MPQISGDLAQATALGEKVAADLRAGVVANGGTLATPGESPDHA